MRVFVVAAVIGLSDLFASCGVSIYGQQTANRTLTILRPLAHEVIQRQGFHPQRAHFNNPDGPDLGFADVPIQFDTDPPLADMLWEYRVAKLQDAFGASVDWQSLKVDSSAEKHATTARVPAGGWYRLEVRGIVAGEVRVSGQVEPIGVGEVFLVAGQSYAAGENDAHLKVSDPHGRIVCFEWERNSWRIAHDPFPHAGDGGTIWPEVGNLLLPILQVPIGFANVAVSGTSSQQWLPDGPLFGRLTTVGQGVGRFRYVLWQQGESDVLENTSTEKYVQNLISIRSNFDQRLDTRSKWLLAKSTLHPTVYNKPSKEAAIRAAIDELCGKHHFDHGPDTDILGGENRGDVNSRRHFSEIGQKRAALMWFAVLLNQLSNEADNTSSTAQGID